MQSPRIEFLDDGPDKLGRRRFFLNWIEPDGDWRSELHPEDGKPIGFRRSQIFLTETIRIGESR